MLQNKTTRSLGLISARSSTGSGSWVPREDRTWDVGGGHRQLWLRAGMVYKLLAFAEEPPGRVWARQLRQRSEEVKPHPGHRANFPGGRRNGAGWRGGDSWGWSQGSFRRAKGGPVKSIRSTRSLGHGRYGSPSSSWGHTQSRDWQVQDDHSHLSHSLVPHSLSFRVSSAASSSHPLLLAHHYTEAPTFFG